ncbi:hypothetical protein LCGC14_2199560, partial [marine sediment metagenome]
TNSTAPAGIVAAGNWDSFLDLGTLQP